MFRIFYSWQSDLPSCSNRGFIDTALQQACKELKTTNGVTRNPVVDRDTLGLPGSPSISDAIFSKIKECDAFVADVTIVNNQHNKCNNRITKIRRYLRNLVDPDNMTNMRVAPNPNVLTELGYALSHIGNDGIILIVNSFYGEIEDLPFDLRGLRTLTYYSDPKVTDRAQSRKELSRNLSNAIQLIGESSRSDPVNAIIFPRTRQVVGQAWGLLRELIKEVNHNAVPEEIKKDELIEVCKQINPNDKAPLIVSQTASGFVYANWLQYMWNQRDRSRKFTEDILVFAPFLDRKHLALLSLVEQCSFFFSIRTVS